MEAAGFSKTSQSIYQITGLHIPQGFFLMVSTAGASNRIADARIEFLATMWLRVQVFWDVILRRGVNGPWR
jgi:hypothetical protein